MSPQAEGSTTLISWCDHTFNPWWGCEHASADDPAPWLREGKSMPEDISEECRHCYAESFDHRLGGEHWGPAREPKWAAPDYWAKLKRWDARAERERKRRRVFVASMADWAQRHPVPEIAARMDVERTHLWQEIAARRWLDFMLLTKRAERLPELLPWEHLAFPAAPGGPFGRADTPWPNVWGGVTVGTLRSMWRVRYLLAARFAVRFISCEPLLELIPDAAWDEALSPRREQCCDRDHDRDGRCDRHPRGRAAIDMLIVGDESGSSRRPCEDAWVETARDAAARHGVAFHLKQLHRDGKKIHLPVFKGRVHDAMPRDRADDVAKSILDTALGFDTATLRQRPQ
jgi:protein gp37